MVDEIKFSNRSVTVVIKDIETAEDLLNVYKANLFEALKFGNAALNQIHDYSQMVVDMIESINCWKHYDDGVNANENNL